VNACEWLGLDCEWNMMKFDKGSISVCLCYDYVYLILCMLNLLICLCYDCLRL
jgi:hypothetical protein